MASRHRGHLAGHAFERRRGPGRPAPVRCARARRTRRRPRPATREPGPPQPGQRAPAPRAPGAGSRPPARSARPPSARSGRPARPASDPAGRQAALEQPPSRWRRVRVATSPGGIGPVGVQPRQRHVGRRSPRDHGPAADAPAAEHLAGPVPGADHHRRVPGAGPARPRSLVSSRPHHRRPTGRSSGPERSGASAPTRSVDGPSGSVVAPAGRGQGGVGGHRAGELPHQQVAGRQHPAGPAEPVGLVGGEPGQLGRHRRGPRA